MGKLDAAAHVQRVRFMPGDKLVARLKVLLTPRQEADLRRALEKWAGDGVPVLIVQQPLLGLDIQRGVPGENGIAQP